jgi:SEC-C motif domain protein
MNVVTCPCGKGESLETCCGPLLAGETKAKTAEELMRSRYSAFATGNVDYVLSTHDPDTVNQVDRAATEAWSAQSEWTGLEIHTVEGGTESDHFGSVEFTANYKIKGAAIAHRERATFRKHNGAWLFVDGEQVAGPPVKREGDKIGRNDPCSCGSGKKYKKCCGAKAA